MLRLGLCSLILFVWATSVLGQGFGLFYLSTTLTKKKLQITEIAMQTEVSRNYASASSSSPIQSVKSSDRSTSPQKKLHFISSINFVLMFSFHLLMFFLLYIPIIFSPILFSLYKHKPYQLLRSQPWRRNRMGSLPSHPPLMKKSCSSKMSRWVHTKLSCGFV